MKLIVHDRGVATAKEQMERDRALLLDPKPALFFYEWQSPSITYGHFIDPGKHLHLDQVASLGFDLARRPTGGGMLFHMDDFVFTVCIPGDHARYSEAVLENYRWINEAVEAAVGEGSNLVLTMPKKGSYDSFCMASPTIYDIVIDGRKVGGSAQRKTRHGYIHQASLFLQEPDWTCLSQMVQERQAIEKMKERSGWLSIPRAELRRSLTQAVQARVSV